MNTWGPPWTMCLGGSPGELTRDLGSRCGVGCGRGVLAQKRGSRGAGWGPGGGVSGSPSPRLPQVSSCLPQVSSCLSAEAPLRQAGLLTLPVPAGRCASGVVTWSLLGGRGNEGSWLMNEGEGRGQGRRRGDPKSCHVLSVLFNDIFYAITKSGVKYRSAGTQPHKLWGLSYRPTCLTKKRSRVGFLGSFHLGLLLKSCTTFALVFFSFPCLRASAWFLISKRICSIHIWDGGPLIPTCMGKREE